MCFVLPHFWAVPSKYTKTEVQCSSEKSPCEPLCKKKNRTFRVIRSAAIKLRLACYISAKTSPKNQNIRFIRKHCHRMSCQTWQVKREPPYRGAGCCLAAGRLDFVPVLCLDPVRGSEVLHRHQTHHGLLRVLHRALLTGKQASGGSRRDRFRLSDFLRTSKSSSPVCCSIDVRSPGKQCIHCDLQLYEKQRGVKSQEDVTARMTLWRIYLSASSVLRLRCG